MILEIDGRDMRSMKDFHAAMKACPAFPDFYGQNFDAFHDSLTGLVEVPFKIIWKNASVSRKRLGKKDFDLLVSIMQDAAEHDASLGWEDKFEFELID